MIFMKPKPCSICKVRDRESNQGYCKPCASDYAEKWRKSNREKLAKYKRLSRANNLIKSFGMTLEEYEAKLQAQGGLCSICGESNAVDRRLAVDHCHTTGKIRDLLCTNCNLGLGNFRDRPELFIAAKAYVERHSA